MRVLVAESQEVARYGLVQGLSLTDGLDIVDAVGSSAEAVAAFAEHCPDVVLCDFDLGDALAPELIVGLREIDPSAKVIVLSSMVEPSAVLVALKAGARGFASKEAKLTTLGQLLLRAGAGEAVLDPTATEVVVTHLSSHGPKAPAGDHRPRALTPKELEVLDHAAHGMTNREIADVMGISQLTVKTHMSSLLYRLGAASRAEAVSLALRSGLLSW